MPSAELIAIGTELLLGEIQDTNTRYLSRHLREIGIDVFRTTIVGDNSFRIAEVIKESLGRADIVITTGGLGPTVDDPTRSAVGLAFEVDVEFQMDLWNEIRQRFLARGIQPTENNRKQAYLPKDSIAIHNPVGTAPAFYLEKNGKMVICLPGVPSEMETIFNLSVIPLLLNFSEVKSVIQTMVLHTSGIGESVVDSIIGDLELMTNPTVGLSAHPGIVDIRITAKSHSMESAQKMITDLEKEILLRLPERVFGRDEETLAGAVGSLARAKNLMIQVEISGLDTALCQKYMMPAGESITVVQGKPETEIQTPFNSAVCVIKVTLQRLEELAILDLVFIYNSTHVDQKKFSGPSSMVETWAMNTACGFCLQNLKRI